MKKILDKLLNNIKFDKRYVMFSFIIIILGIITGSLFLVILKNSDKALVVEYIESFIDNIKNNNIDYTDLLKNTIIINYIVILAISIIGFTYFLFPINILILYYKSFIIGFSLGSFILTYKIKGILLSVIYIFPHLIINILLFAILTAFTLKVSINMINHIIKRKDVNMSLYFSKYIRIALIFIFLITLTSIYESIISSNLLKLIINFIF